MGVAKEDDRNGTGGSSLGTFLLWSGSVILGSALLIGLFNFGTTWLTYGPAIVGALMMSVGLVMSYGRLRKQFSQRRLQYVMMTLSYLAVLVVLLTGVNTFLHQRPVMHDFTNQSVFTLSDQTTALLNDIPDPVRVTAFLERSDPLYGVFEKYRSVFEGSSNKVEFRVVSPSQELEEIRKYEVTAQSPPFIAEVGWLSAETRRENRFRLDLRSLDHESRITNAIRRAAVEKRPSIVIVGGHGEADPLQKDGTGLSEATKELTEEGYQVIPINLVVAQAIPPETSVVLIPGLRTRMLPPEIAALKGYLNQGGSALVMLEPEAEHGLEGLLGGYGVFVNPDVVLDVSPFGKMYGERTAIAVDYGAHPVTEKFKNAMSIFPGARSLSVSQGTNAKPMPLLRTSEQAWGETDFSGLRNGTAAWDEGEARGPITLAIASEIASADDKRPSRLVVAGDANFSTNGERKLGANRDVFMNMVAWLAQDEANIAIRPHVRGANFITLTPAQRDGIAFFVLYLLPTLLLSIGLGVWFARRGR